MEEMLRIENLQVKYGSYNAVSSASVRVAKGRIAALIGANGAGKTSLLQAAAGLISPAAGKIYFDGEDITGLSADQVVRRGLCLVPQGARCFLRMSVRDNLIIGSYPGEARKHASSSMERVLTLFPMLKEKLKEPAGSLSGGQRQMLSIGRAMMSGPKCLMFDEISMGLAPITSRALYARILEINQNDGVTVILVEQNTEQALAVSDVCFVMLKGEVKLSGESSGLGRQELRSAYFGLEKV